MNVSISENENNQDLVPDEIDSEDENDKIQSYIKTSK